MKFLSNVVKNKLKSGKSTIGSWINLPCLETVEMLSQTQIDFLVIDREHTAISLELAQKMLMIIEANGKIPYVRVAANDPTEIKKVLDMGAYGVIVPMVNSLAEAKKAKEAVFYPPKGKRGVGLSRAQGYGLDFDRYQKWFQKNASLILQIEHIDAIHSLDEILKLSGVDATMIGPYDLSGSLGMPGQYEKSQVKQAMKTYEQKSKEHNVPMGFHIVQPDKSKLSKLKKARYQFLPYGIDEILFKQKCCELNEL